MQGVLKMLRRLLGEHIALTFQSESGLPMIEADGGMLEQVVMNLCVNARDAMPRGGQVTQGLMVSRWAAGGASNPNSLLGAFLGSRFPIPEPAWMSIPGGTSLNCSSPTKGPGKGTA